MNKNKPKPLDLEEIKKKVEDIIKPKPLDLSRLEKELLKIWDIWNKTNEEFIELAVFKFKHCIKQACKFYLRYKDNPGLLAKEHPKLKEEIGNIFPLDYNKKTFEEAYNEWLFKLAFKGVFENQNGDKE